MSWQSQDWRDTHYAKSLHFVQKFIYESKSGPSGPKNLIYTDENLLFGQKLYFWHSVREVLKKEEYRKMKVELQLQKSPSCKLWWKFSSNTISWIELSRSWKWCIFLPVDHYSIPSFTIVKPGFCLMPEFQSHCCSRDATKLQFNQNLCRSTKRFAFWGFSYVVGLLKSTKTSNTNCILPAGMTW